MQRDCGSFSNYISVKENQSLEKLNFKQIVRGISDSKQVLNKILIVSE